MNRTILSLLAVVPLLLAACAGDQGDASTAADAESQAPQSEAATESAEADASIGLLPSFDLSGDPELADRFPDTVGGQPLEVQSFRGDIFMETDADPAFETFLDSVGADLQDVSVAFGGVMSTDTFLSVGAFRVVGADEGQLETEFLAASEAEGDLTGLERTTIGGKEVWTATDATAEAAGQVYIYVQDDTVYFVTGTEAQAAEIFEALP